MILAAQALATAEGQNFQRPEQFDIVPVTNLAISKGAQTLQVITRFPNGCYQSWETFKEVEGHRLTLYHVATYPKGAACSRVVEYNHLSFGIENLRPGDYDVIDGEDGTYLATLEKTVSSARLVSPQ